MTTARSIHTDTSHCLTVRAAPAPAAAVVMELVTYKWREKGQMSVDTGNTSVTANTKRENGVKFTLLT